MNKQDLDSPAEKAVFKFGDAVELVDAKGVWRPGKIVKEMAAGESAARFKVHFDNSRTSCDEWVALDEVINKMRHQAGMDSLGDFVHSDIIKNIKGYMALPKRNHSRPAAKRAKLSPPSSHNKNNLSVASTTELAYSLTDSNISISTNGNNEVPSSSSTGKENCDQNDDDDDLADTTDEMIVVVNNSVNTSNFEDVTNNNNNKNKSKKKPSKKEQEPQVTIVKNSAAEEIIDDGKTYNTRKKPLKKYTLDTIIIDDSFKDKVGSPLNTSNSQKKKKTDENVDLKVESNKKSVKKNRSGAGPLRSSLKKRKRPTIKRGTSLIESSYDENFNEHNNTNDVENVYEKSKEPKLNCDANNQHQLRDFAKFLKKVECNCEGKFSVSGGDVFVVVCACCRTRYHNVCVGVESVNSQAKFVCKNCISKKKCRKLATFSTNWRTNWMYAKRFKDERLNNRLGLNERTDTFLFIDMAEKLKTIREKLKCAKFEEGSEQQLAKLEQLRKIQSLIQQYGEKQKF